MRTVFIAIFSCLLFEYHSKASTPWDYISTQMKISIIEKAQLAACNSFLLNEVTQGLESQDPIDFSDAIGNDSKYEFIDDYVNIFLLNHNKISSLASDKFHVFMIKEFANLDPTSHIELDHHTSQVYLEILIDLEQIASRDKSKAPYFIATDSELDKAYVKYLEKIANDKEVELNKDNMEIDYKSDKAYKKYLETIASDMEIDSEADKKRFYDQYVENTVTKKSKIDEEMKQCVEQLTLNATSIFDSQRRKRGFKYAKLDRSLLVAALPYYFEYSQLDWVAFNPNEFIRLYADDFRQDMDSRKMGHSKISLTNQCELLYQFVEENQDRIFIGVEETE